jgi:signal transduction histidine kinase
VIGTATLTPGAALASLLVGLVCVGGGQVIGGDPVSSPLNWLLCGVAAATTLRWGWRAGLVALVGAALSMAMLGLLAQPRWFLAGSVGAFAGALTLQALLRAIDCPTDLARCRDVLRFFAAATAAMLVPALVTALGVVVMAPELAPDWPLMALRWAFSGAIATLLVAPPLLAAGPATLQAWRQRSATALGLLLLAAAIAAIALLRPPGYLWTMLLGLPVVAVAAIRLDRASSGLLALMLAVSAMLGVDWAELRDANALAALESGRLWAYCLLLSGLPLVVHALRAERDSAESQVRVARAMHRIQVLAAGIREQESIGREVRERLGRDLATLAGAIEALGAQAATLAPELLDDVAAMRLACGRSEEAAEAVAQGLMPSIDRDGDLGLALAALAERVPRGAGIEVVLQVAREVAVPPVPARNLYRIAQEALNNLVKHSQAHHARIALGRDAAGVIELSIEDDGVGLQSPAADTGLGLRTMHQRAELAGGTLEVLASPGRGTVVRCRIPAEPPVAAGRPRPTAARRTPTTGCD